MLPHTPCSSALRPLGVGTLQDRFCHSNVTLLCGGQRPLLLTCGRLEHCWRAVPSVCACESAGGLWLLRGGRGSRASTASMSVAALSPPSWPDDVTAVITMVVVVMMMMINDDDEGAPDPWVGGDEDKATG